MMSYKKGTWDVQTIVVFIIILVFLIVAVAINTGLKDFIFDKINFLFG